MNAKRWEIIDEEFISYTGGTAQLISNGECKVHLWETPKDAQLFCDKLNKLHEENTMLKERRHEDINDLSVIAMKYKALEKENEQLKKALWCIRKRYGYTVEEFIEDLKDNGIDLTKVNLE